MVHSYLFIDLIIIIVAAFFGAIAVRLLRLPTILGYLGVGILVGPHGLGLVREVESVETLAEFGVILLLFAVGVELSLSDLRKVGNRTVAAGALQIGAMMAVGFGVGRLLGWSGGQTVVLGFVLALSSTMVVLKTLSDRGELQMVHGRILTGFMLLQDLAFVPMIAVIPALSGDGGLDLAGLGIGLGQAFAVLGLILLLGGRVVPWLLTRVANIGSRETFVLAVVTIAFAAAAPPTPSASPPPWARSRQDWSSPSRTGSATRRCSRLCPCGTSSPPSSSPASAPPPTPHLSSTTCRSFFCSPPSPSS